MEQITLTYDAENPLAKKTLDFILSLGIFKINQRKTAIEKSLEEIKNGEVNTYENVDDFFKNVVEEDVQNYNDKSL